jgi:RNA polymerase sigma-70 factor, ECF subfamily
MLTDEQLMAAIVTGDRHAYAEVVSKHARLLAAYAWRMLGSESEAQDIVQETFLRLWMQAQRWDSQKSALSTWLHRIAHNLCIDALRKMNKVRESSDDEITELLDERESAEQEISRESLEFQLHAAIAALPERQRSALILVHFQGLTNKELAEILDISVDALESLLSRARRTLKHRLTTSELASASAKRRSIRS